MKADIQIIEKPDWVSWEEIKQCLSDAHATNRANGINMAHYQWPAEKIIETIGENGVFLVALDDKKLVGVAAIAEKRADTWYAKGRFAYMCFAGVLPSYSGEGLYHRLTAKREEIAKSMGYQTLVFDTHQNNKKIQSIAIQNGYRLVRFFRASSKDHYSVVMAKWLNGCPYSVGYCWIKYNMSRLKTIVRYPLKK